MSGYESKAETLAKHIGPASRRFVKGCEKEGQEAVILADDGFRQFNLYSISAQTPETVRLLGETDDGTHIEVSLHYSAVRVTMLAVPKSDPRPKSRGIGFTADHRDEKGEAEA